MITAKKHLGGVEVSVNGNITDTFDELAAIVLSFVEQRKDNISPQDMLESTITVVYKLCEANLYNNHSSIAKDGIKQ